MENAHYNFHDLKDSPECAVLLLEAKAGRRLICDCHSDRGMYKESSLFRILHLNTQNLPKQPRVNHVLVYVFGTQVTWSAKRKAQLYSTSKLKHFSGDVLTKHLTAPVQP